MRRQGFQQAKAWGAIRKSWGAVAFLLLIALPSYAQVSLTDQPRGRFLRPAVRVGELVDYELTYRHLPSLEVIFPDSTAEFRPFEFVGKTYLPTRTRQGRSLDRTVYHLRTFALDPVQRLSLPVTILRGRDTLTISCLPSSIQLMRTAPNAASATPPTLHQNTALLPVSERFNYPYWLAGVGLVLLAGLGLTALFRRNLQQRYQLYKLRKNHVYFLAQYARHVERFAISRSLTNMERAITLWKNYLTNLENNTINSLTTKEIVSHYQNSTEISRALHIADRVIYGNQLTDEEQETEEAFSLLRNFAERRYDLVATTFGR